LNEHPAARPSTSTPVAWEWHGLVPYAQALNQQRARRDAIIAGKATEILWLLEHPPVVTVGRRPAPGTPDPKMLSAQGVAFAQTERGGLATFHGPGQLVAYVLVNAAERKLGVRGLVHAMESAVIDWLGTHDVQAHRRTGLPGVWVGTEKICALGLHFRRGVSMHGLALNLNPDLERFELILPCGIRQGGVTSFAAIRGKAPSPEDAARELGDRLSQTIQLVG